MTMELRIGEKIKALRHASDLTQEEGLWRKYNSFSKSYLQNLLCRHDNSNNELKFIRIDPTSASLPTKAGATARLVQLKTNKSNF